MKDAPGVGRGLVPAGVGQPERRARGTEVLPLDGYLRSLAPSAPYVQPFESAFIQDFPPAPVAPVIVSIGTYEVPEGMSLVLTRYRFWAEEPDIGLRTAILPLHLLAQRVELISKYSGYEPVQGSYTGPAKAGFGGQVALEPEITGDPPSVPLYLHGHGVLEALMNILVFPLPFTVSKIGFYFSGFTVNSTSLKAKLDAMVEW